VEGNLLVVHLVTLWEHLVSFLSKCQFCSHILFCLRLFL
jgi:hypothetical protein